MRVYNEVQEFSPSTSESVCISTASLKLYKSLPRNQFPSTCSVCQHRSTGYHYDVASCNGCKSFFRRAVINCARYTCREDNVCFDSSHPINNVRLSCRACRFQKCVDVGMNPTAIKYELSKSAQEFIDEIRNTQENKNTAAIKLEISFSQPLPEVTQLLFSEEVVSRTICRLSAIESLSSKIHDEGLPDGFCDYRNLEEILKSTMIRKNSDIPNLRIRLSEGTNIQPAIYAHCSFLASVEYSKTFDFYDKITVSDKIRLVRHVVAACAALHDAFFSINSFKSDCLMFPNGVKFVQNKEDERKIGFFEKTLVAVLRNKMDRVEYMLLKAIVLCNPAVCSLSKRAQQLLEKERRQYGFCLLQYCKLQHGAVNGASRYAELISITPVVENQVKLLKDLYTLMTIMAMKSGKVITWSKLFEQLLES